MRRHRRWSLASPALCALIALGALSACGGDSPVSSGSAMRIVTDTQVAPTTAAPTTAATAATAAVDPIALIGAGIDGLAAGYHFTTTVTLDGADVLVADGDHVGDGTRLTVTRTDGPSVDYVITPSGSWVRPTDGEWDVVAADTPATTDPIAALRAPTSATVAAVDGTITTIVATVPALALGVAAEGDAQVQITIDGTALRSITYAAPIDGRSAVVGTVIGPVADATAVVAPI